MPTKYTSFSNIQEGFVLQFERYWNDTIKDLPAIETNIQNAENVKAAVYNVWLNYANVTQYLFLKIDRQILHAFDERLMKKINSYLWENKYLKKLFHEHKHDQLFVFAFSYFLTKTIFEELNQFIQQHPVLKRTDLKKYPYYYWSDNDLEQNDNIYLVMKYLNTEFINEYMTEGRVKKISIRIYEALLNTNLLTE